MLRLSGQDVEVNTQTKFLLYHCKSNPPIWGRVIWVSLVLNHRSKSLCTVTVETGWLTYALRDSAVFNSTLYHWASLNFDFLPTEFRTETNLLQLKGAIIRMINRRLGSHKQGGVSDEIIASVACLTNVTVCWLPAMTGANYWRSS